MTTSNLKTAGLISLIIFGIVVAYLGFNALQNQKYGCQGCNVVVISVDPLRADHTSLHGYERDTTPFLNQLSGDSLVFDNTYSQSSQTFTSTISFFTGRYPSGHGITPKKAKKPDFTSRWTHLAEVFNESGYETIAITGGGNTRKDLGLEKGFSYYDDDVSTDRNTSLVASKIDENSDESFFLFYQGYQTHDPFIAPERYSDLYEPTLPDFRRKVFEKREYVKEKNNLTPTEEFLAVRNMYFPKVNNNETFRNFTMAQYDGQVRYADDKVEEIVGYLEENNLRDETIIVFTSMHGEMMGEKDEWGHHFYLDNPVLRVPLLINYPGLEGKRIEEPVELIDIPVTLIDISGVEGRDFYEQTQGDSILKLLKDQKFDNRFSWAENVNLNKRVLLDHKTGYKLYSENDENTLYKFDGYSQQKVNNSDVREKMVQKYRNFLREIKGSEGNTSETQPYFYE